MNLRTYSQPIEKLTTGGDLREAQVDVPLVCLVIPAFDRTAGLENRHLKL